MPSLCFLLEITRRVCRSSAEKLQTWENSSSRMDIPDAPVLPLAFLRRHKLGKSFGLRKSSVKRWTSLLEKQTSVGKPRKEVLHTAKRTRHLETYVGRTGNLSRQKMLWLNSWWFRVLRSGAAPQGLHWKAEQCSIGSAYGAWLALFGIWWLIHTLKKEMYPGQLAPCKKKQASVELE